MSDNIYGCVHVHAHTSLHIILPAFSFLVKEFNCSSELPGALFYRRLSVNVDDVRPCADACMRAGASSFVACTVHSILVSVCRTEQKLFSELAGAERSVSVWLLPKAEEPSCRRRGSSCSPTTISGEIT